jgi:hypothetical protein
VRQPKPSHDARPWDEPGAVRRECEPHWGPALQLLARAGLAVGALSAALARLTPLGLAYAPHDPASPPSPPPAWRWPPVRGGWPGPCGGCAAATSP